jgi:hypothetical protein
MSTDPDEMVTFRQVAHTGVILEIEMPRRAVEAIERGESVTYRSADEPEIRTDEGGRTIRRYKWGA